MTSPETVLPATQSDTQPAVEFVGIAKTFGAVRALRGINLTIRRNEVHALVGENGAGKSTCLGVLAGRVTPDRGDVKLFGMPASLGNPRAARHAGVASIFQELTIVPHLSTQANVFLGTDRARLGFLREREMIEEFQRLCDRLNVELPVDRPAGELSIANQQLLEIMRALTLDPQLILFDEPTASLGQREREVFYEIVRSLRAEGRTVAFVSHNLNEVLDLSDTVTVFRDGQLIETQPASRWTQETLVDAMLSPAVRDTMRAYAATGHESEKVSGAGDSTPALKVIDLAVGDKVRGIDLEVHPGGILGIAGLVGSGRSTVMRAIIGAQHVKSGRMVFEGEEVPWPRTVRAATRLGIFSVPEERRRSGLVMGLSALENIVLSDIGAASRWGYVGRRAGLERAHEAARAVGFAETRLGDRVAGLSGGNQQKVVLARAVYRNPKVLLADEPTRGVDVGSKAEIAESLRRLAAGGMAVIVVSSELEELEALCDEVVVMTRGRLAGSLQGDELTVHDMLRLVFRQVPEVQR